MTGPIYMVMFGSYTESIRHFATADAAFDFIVDVIKNKTMVHHPKVGAGTIRSTAKLGDAKVYEVHVGTNVQPSRIEKSRMNKEFSKRGLKKSGSSWE